MVLRARLGLRARPGAHADSPHPPDRRRTNGLVVRFSEALLLTLLLIQIVTGIGLALVYVPAADQAYESLLFLNYEQPLGWFLACAALLRRVGNGGFCSSFI